MTVENLTGFETISVEGCREYDPVILDAAMERHFARLDPNGELLRPGTKVVVKPNLIMRRRPEEATTTHPLFLAALIRAVNKRGGEVTLADSPGGPYSRTVLRAVYEGTGMAGVARETGALLNYDTGYTNVLAEGGAVCSSFPVLNPLLEADVVISAAKLKTHGMMNYSGAVKNMFGSVPGLMKPEFHYRFPERDSFGEMIVDLCATVHPELSFIDGIVAMEGNGPTGGSPRFMGVTLASRNPHALDLAAASLAGFVPEEVPTLKAAIRRGLCPAEASLLRLAGDNFAGFALSDFKKPQSKEIAFSDTMPLPLRRLAAALLTPRPVIRLKTCVGCGKCAESCPQKAISIVKGKACIRYKSCIRCYCCHEMCPIKSIDIHRMGLFGRSRS